MSTAWLAELKTSYLAISFSLWNKARNIYPDYLGLVFAIFCLTVASSLNMVLCIVGAVLTSD